MALRWYYSVNATTVLEITDRVNWPDIEVGGSANQDSWNGDLIVDDPSGDFIPLAYRRIYANEDTAPVGSQVIGNWFINPTIKVKREGNSPVGASRTYVISMADENSLLDRRKFVGSDSKRPAETAIARIRWMLTTTEANTLDANEDFIEADTTMLDAAPLFGQTPGEVLASIMGRTGRQYWVMYREDLTPHVYGLWYGNMNTSALYASTASISNIESEVTGGAGLVFALSQSAELERALGRMASGLLGPWKQKTEYIQDPAVGGAYAFVDQTAGDLYNVTTEASAIAQITRQLHELALPDDEITTTVTVQSADINLIKHGMIVPVHASHFPNYTDTDTKPGYAADFVQCRVMERTIRQVGPTTFELPLRLSPMYVPGCDVTSVAFVNHVGAINAGNPMSQAPWSVSAAVSTPSETAGLILGFITNFSEWDAVASIGEAISLPGGSAWTSITANTFQTPDNAHVLGMVATQPIGGTPDPLAVTLPRQNSAYYAQFASIRTASTSPVQTAYLEERTSTLPLGAAPTQGNIMVLCFLDTVPSQGSPAPINPADFFDWSVVVNETFGSTGPVVNGRSMILMRCAGAGEPTTIDVPAGYHDDLGFVMYSEWLPD